MAKASAKSAIRNNLSILTNGISAQPTVFSEVVNGCGEKKLITPKQAKEYVDNSAGKEISIRAGNLVHSIMAVTDVIPESLDTFLCILYDSDDLLLRKVASKIANDYGRDLPQYNARLDSDTNEDIPANTHVSSSNSLPPSPPRKPSNHSSSFSNSMKFLVFLAVVVAVIRASPFIYSYLDIGSKGPENTFIEPPVVEEKLDNGDVPFQHTETPPNNDPLPPPLSAGKETIPVVKKNLDNADVPSQDTDTQPNNGPLPPSSSAGKGHKETIPVVKKKLDNVDDVPFQHTDTPPNNDPLPPSSSDEEPLMLRDLYKVMQSLKDNDYDVSTWSGLCLALGLSQSRINTIKKDEMDSNDRLRSCLYQWLNRVDQVDEFGGATLASLVTALESIDQKPVAEKLKERTK